MKTMSFLMAALGFAVYTTGQALASDSSSQASGQSPTENHQAGEHLTGLSHNKRPPGNKDRKDGKHTHDKSDPADDPPSPSAHKVEPAGKLTHKPIHDHQPAVTTGNTTTPAQPPSLTPVAQNTTQPPASAATNIAAKNTTTLPPAPTGKANSTAPRSATETTLPDGTIRTGTSGWNHINSGSPAKPPILPTANTIMTASGRRTPCQAIIGGNANVTPKNKTTLNGTTMTRWR